MSRLPDCVRWLLICGVCLCAASPALADKVPDRPAAPAAAPADAPAMAPTPASAAAPAPAVAPTAVKPDAEGFVPDSRPPNMNTVDESIPAAPLVATAYGFIWAAVLAFVLLTLQRTRKLEQELSELAERIQAKAPRA